MESEINKKIKHQLKIAKGQIDGILKMVEEGSYCIPVITQLSATDKVLKRAASLLIERHILNCVKSAGKADKKEFDGKLQELIKTFRTFI